MKRGNKAAAASKEAKELLDIRDCEMHFFGGIGYIVNRGYDKVRISKVSIVNGSAAPDHAIELKVLESMLLPQELIQKCVSFEGPSPFDDDDVIPF